MLPKSAVWFPSCVSADGQHGASVRKGPESDPQSKALNPSLYITSNQAWPINTLHPRGAEPLWHLCSLSDCWSLLWLKMKIICGSPAEPVQTTTTFPQRMKTHFPPFFRAWYLSLTLYRTRWPLWPFRGRKQDEVSAATKQRTGHLHGNRRAPAASQ